MVKSVHTLERQNSTAGRSEQSNAFSDRFEIEEYSPVDGMDGRQERDGSRRPSRTSDEEEVVTSVAAHYADDHLQPSQPLREARNSIRKSRGFSDNPFQGEDEDGGRGPSQSTQLTTLSPQMTGDTYRTDNNSLSGNTVVSSTHGNGPSHPYDQYTQHTSLTRSPTAPSTITAQTTGRQSLHGPSHQYNMYPQNVEEDIDDVQSQAGTNHNIPMGFPPTLLNVSTFRHDADNLSEQLPPYSEYPEDGAPKQVSVPPRIDEVSPTSDSSPTLRNPQSMSDNNRTPDVSSSDDEAGPVDEKKWKDKTWKEKRKTRVCCGIKFGWIALVIGVFLFIVIVLAATIGGFFGAQARENAKKANENTLIDASPIRSSMMPLPTGSFQLQLGAPQEVQAECLTDQSQIGSWDCGISSPGSLAISIGPGPNGNGQGAYIYQATNDFKIGYGTEIPHTVWSPLRPVKDMDAPNRGPAYQFQAVYTKIVIAKPDAFQPAKVDQSGSSTASQSSTNSKRESQFDKRYWAPLANAGDQPWFCYWNNTLIEGFIYVQENSTSWYGDKSRRYMEKRDDKWSIPSFTATSGQPFPTSFLQDWQISQFSSLSSQSTTSANLAAATSVSTPTTTGTYPASACTYSSGTAYPANPSSTPETCPPALGEDPWSKLDFYPFVVKIEERRIPGDTMRPYCQKMQVLDNGGLGYLQDATGNPYIVQLSESSPDINAYTNVYGAGSRKMRRGERAVFAPSPLEEEEDAQLEKRDDTVKRAVVDGACHCQWVSGEN
ncbi:hypothetical protein KVT40_001130 [Elsinoe batatas]|uniref:DUF7820 domain-containing protein n=1 Tax=Elsinoe batatas TaxID=2601811 RepID=A0A8K0LDB7_9PEZI|nr:hypothetical protein KVT40_001130 [Elsinoe batatas]